MRHVQTGWERSDLRDNGAHDAENVEGDVDLNVVPAETDDTGIGVGEEERLYDASRCGDCLGHDCLDQWQWLSLPGNASVTMRVSTKANYMIGWTTDGICRDFFSSFPGHHSLSTDCVHAHRRRAKTFLVWARLHDLASDS